MSQVSILTSVYNKAPWLSRFFDSIINQTFEDFELIVVNNGSTDNSVEIIKEYKIKDSRIKVIDVKDNRGPAGGIQTAINNVNSPYFTVLDADDYIDNNYISQLYQAIVNYNADVAMCINDIVLANGSIKHKPWPKEKLYIIDGANAKYLPCQLLDELSDEYFGFHMPEIGAEWCKLYKTDLIKSNNIRYEDDLWKWVDWVFNLNVMMKVKKMVYLSTTVYHFCQTDNSATRSSKYNNKHVDFLLKAVERISDYIEGKDIPNICQSSSRFYYNRLREIVNYNITFLSSGASKQDLNRALERFNNLRASQVLYKNERLFTVRQKIFLFLTKHNNASIIIFVKKMRKIFSKLFLK